MANKTIGSGLNHVEIKDTDGNVYDVEAVIKLEGSPDAEKTDVKGDDVVKATFYSQRTAEITIEANALTMDVLSAITGNTVTDVTGPPTAKQINFGTDSEDNPPFVSVQGKIRAKNPATGAPATIEVLIHRVQLSAPPVSASIGDEFSVELSGMAYKTSVDIEGNNLSERCLGTLISVDDDTTE